MGPHEGIEVNGAGVDISCSPLASWLLGWEKRVFFSLRKGCVTCPWICHRRRFRWCVVWHNRIKARCRRGDPGMHGFVTDRQGLLWGCVGFGVSFGALAHAVARGGPVPCWCAGARVPCRSGGCFRRCATPPRQTTLPHLVEPLEPPPACPFAGRSAQGSSAAFTPDPLVRPLPRPGWCRSDPGVRVVVLDGSGVRCEPRSLSGDAGV